MNSMSMHHFEWKEVPEFLVPVGFQWDLNALNKPTNRFWDPVRRMRGFNLSGIAKPPIHVDDITPELEEQYLTKFFISTKSALIVEFDKLLGINCKEEDCQFITSAKRCYSNTAMRDHLPLYLNYFETYYDTDHELIMVLYHIKTMIDHQREYTFKNMMSDINRYILHSKLSALAMVMVNDCYTSNLDDSRFTNDKNLSLVYRDKHTKILFWMSLLQNMIIPIATEFIYMRQVDNTTSFLMKVFDPILGLADGININNKLFQTASSNILKHSKINEGLWTIQGIRGKTKTTHSLDSVENIILNIMPKYVFKTSSIVSFNHASIKRHDYFHVSGIKYEFEFVPLNSGTRDAENVSSWDKYEAYMTRQSPLMQIHHKVAAQDAMDKITRMYGPFDDKEVQFIMDRLTDGMANVNNIIMSFQSSLIMDLFGKEFGDPLTSTQISSIDYIKLMIACRRKLEDAGMVVLPWLLTSKIVHFQYKKNISKKIMDKIIGNVLWKAIQEKYGHSEQIETYVQSTIATMLTSQFKIVSYEDEDIDDKIISCTAAEDMIIDEFLRFITMI